jgi:hypothetical protein
VVTAFERILNLGGVQKVTIELGLPIKVVRLAESGPEVPEDIQDDDLVSAARNAPMEEFVFPEELPPTVYLFRAFRLLSSKRLRGKGMVVNSLTTLREWFRVDADFDLSEVFGVPVTVHKEIPDGALLFVASPIDDADLVSFSLRLELPVEKNS